MAREKTSSSFQVPLMLAFRDANRQGDAKIRIDQRSEGERVLADRTAMRRRGVGEATLKQDLATDLLSLLNTIDLHSTEPLDDFEYVRKSVVNYGLPDVSYLTSEQDAVKDIADNLKQALLNFEPRLFADALHVERQDVFDEVNQRIRFVVSAEMACKPFDVPIEFVAEVEVGSGKIHLSRLPIAK